MLGLFLTPEELQELTGYKRRSEQTRWLRSYSIPFALDRWGRPRVLRSEIERALSSPEDATATRPKLEHIRRKAS